MLSSPNAAPPRRDNLRRSRRRRGLGGATLTGGPSQLKPQSVRPRAGVTLPPSLYQSNWKFSGVMTLHRLDDAVVSASSPAALLVVAEACAAATSAFS